MITVFGSINADLIFPVPALPTPGQTLLSTGLRAQPGGKGANQAAAAALDAEPGTVAFFAAIGTDALADIALAYLRELPIDLSGVATIAGSTGCACICTDPVGRNQIVVAPGVNHALRAAAVPAANLRPPHTLITQMETDPVETAALIRRAHAAGARTIHNHAPAAPIDPDALDCVDILVVNEDEAAWLAQNTAPNHAAILIRTLGAAGVEWHGEQGRGHIPALPITALDTTAAGDCFVGTLAAALDRGLPLPAAIARANVAAALTCEKPGSQRSLPTRADIDRRLSQ